MNDHLAPRFVMRTVRDGYPDLIDYLLTHGEKVAPRGLPCREVVGATLVVLNPRDDAMPVACGRGVNPAIGAVESLQLVGGCQTPNLLEKVAPNFAQFRDQPGAAFYGAYGPRAAEALPRVQRMLSDDPDTRQAIVPIFERRDVGAETRDLPCTLVLQFLVRDGKLQLHTTMRSNDVWWGWSYDAFQFTRLQQAMAASLGIDLGPYVHHAGSFHLYERDVEDAEGVKLAERSEHDWLAPALELGVAPYRRYMEVARGLLHGFAHGGDVNAWYSTTLAKYDPSQFGEPW